jgi:hypothetical protein
MPPVAVMVSVYDVFARHEGRVGSVEMESTAMLTVIENCPLTEFEAESVAVRVNVGPGLAVVAVGIPVIAPAEESVRPAGNAPALSDHV